MADSVALVRHALDLGITLVDTAEAYGTEALVGEALQSSERAAIVLSTKKSITKQDRLITAADLARGLEASLRQLRTDYIDIYHLHAVRADQYSYVVTELVPAMRKLRDQGKIRFLGITEAFHTDPGHLMLARAVQDECWDVVMAGFNILNQSARDRVFAETSRRGIGVLCMFAVRTALSQPEKLRQTVATLVREGAIDPGMVDEADPLGFVRQSEDNPSVPEAGYRFCRAEPGIHVVLSGTGNPRHLEQNVTAILRPPLSTRIHQRLVTMFARVDTVSGD